ncbi:DUF4132 domain-containing protein [Marinitenerispora sediminis]|uniref:DUF4132 domain-containing protein n=1 Tax=Marinitenerispora sediminis TaxID=1931232 RepID=A0A368TBQ6_9ACTN|nr:DUF4132 domain-containing protein [Marinitenerispora sediminis]RCV58171.1 DUF4132 domain-containing protein [Marinitenerispora sediminis]RCV62542.1 DUF4132 domain-containing protein [Marinitenerispora sediminis]
MNTEQGASGPAVTEADLDSPELTGARPGDVADFLLRRFRLPEEDRPYVTMLSELGGPVAVRLELAVAKIIPPVNWWQRVAKLKGTEVDEVFRSCDDAGLRAAGMWALVRLARNGDPYKANGHRAVLAAMARRGLPWTGAQLRAMLRMAEGQGRYDYHTAELAKLPIAACERADDVLLAECVAELRALHAVLGRSAYADGRRLHARAEALLGRLTASGESAENLFGEDDAFGALLRREAPDALRTPGLAALLQRCGTLSGTRPTKAWRTQVQAVLRDHPDVLAAARAVLAQLPRLPDSAIYVGHEYLSDTTHIGSENTQLMLRGLLWSLDVAPRAETTWAPALLADVARFAGTGRGGSKVLRAERLATAAVAALGARGDEAAVAGLARVRAKVVKKTVAGAVDRALDTCAERLGLTRWELVERTVPDFGFGPDARREDVLGEHTAILRLDSDGGPVLTFRGSAGRELKSVPKAVREAHADRLVELRAELKELKSTLPAERFRIETALAEGRMWYLADWRRYYLEHPLTGWFARALIWEVSTDAGATWRDGVPEPDGGHWRLVGPEGAEVFRTDGESAAPPQVRLWHPIRATPDRVHAWREHFLAARLRQPVKQAYREIYLLTPAEEETRTYSNRYAAHILRYPQAKALLAGRGWSGLTLGYWDGGFDGSAERVYHDAASGTDWAAACYLELAEHPDDDYTRVSYCSSDQVRIGRAGVVDDEGDLRDVPALVFSEVMRDMDLAVGVASIAADPEWVDRGEDRYLAYWREAGFGKLTESAEMRRTALERLIPRLKIADRLELTDRFLRVRGDLRGYRIHLGSANILMEPDDSYLCIVTARGGGSEVFLPFESDGGRLSVILSKAFLLADDAAITDSSITSQIRRGLPR